MARPALEVADILSRRGDAFMARHPLSRDQIKVVSAIRACRTAGLGDHVARCDSCDHTRIAYNSCPNRHCPKCQGHTARNWLADRQADLLPVPYFHLVFTMPAPIARIALLNARMAATSSAQQIEQCGTPAEIYDCSATVFVAGFIGTTNLLSGTVFRSNTYDLLVRTSVGFVMTAVDLPREGHDVTLCLRPESIQVTPHPGGALSKVNMVHGALERIIHRGRVTELHVRLSKGDTLIALRPSGEGDSLTLGQPVLARREGKRVYSIP